MDNEFDKINYWMELAQYDLKTAKAMLRSKRYLYVGFMCNQVVEKIFKAYYVKEKKTQPPYIHKLAKLAKTSNLYEEMNETQKDFLDTLEPLNIEARYPTQKQEIFESLNRIKCKNIVKETEALVKWIEKKLKS